MYSCCWLPWHLPMLTEHTRMWWTGRRRTVSPLLCCTLGHASSSPSGSHCGLELRPPLTYRLLLVNTVLYLLTPRLLKSAAGFPTSDGPPEHWHNVLSTQRAHTHTHTNSYPPPWTPKACSVLSWVQYLHREISDLWTKSLCKGIIHNSYMYV